MAGRGHKYIRRTGSKGNYKYWYKLPDGRVVEGNDSQQKSGRVEHVKRLIAGKIEGIHDMSHDKIAAVTGHPASKVRSTASNMATRARSTGQRHDFESSHLMEAKHQYPHSDDYAAAHAPGTTAGPAPAAAAPARRGSDRVPGFPDMPIESADERNAKKKKQRVKELRAKLKQKHGVDLGGETPASVGSGKSLRAMVQAALDVRNSPAAEAAPPKPKLVAQRDSAPQETAERVRSVRTRLATEGNAALAEADPEHQAFEAPIERMEEAASSGSNPYLSRAKEIFGRIKDDIKPERKNKVNNFLKAVDEVGLEDESALLAKYKEHAGGRVRTIPWDDVEKATFMTKDELLNNPPIDASVERMKRGYAQMQYARMEPFLKDSWKTSNPDAPPPFPTFGDVKSWREHGGDKPSWAGTTRLAMPKEVFDAVNKVDGKPQYPPAWFPIHHMPVWNYVSKKMGSGAYQASPSPNTIEGGNVNLPNQAGQMEGVIISSLRKYVQMRGGVDQLVDIPKSKLSEVGISHADIFKAQEVSDDQLKKLFATKMIDVAELTGLIEKDLGKKVKKSISYIIGDTIPFKIKKSDMFDKLVSSRALTKSRIRTIKRLLHERRIAEMS